MKTFQYKNECYGFSWWKETQYLIEIVGVVS